MRIIGIDPGLTGGLARIDRSGLLIEPMPVNDGVLDLPALTRLIAAMATEDNAHAYVEKVAAMPKNGSIACFKLGDSFGAVKGILAALKIPYTLVTPQKWKKEMLSGIEALEDKKAMSAVAASRIFPAIDFRASDRCRKPHSGMVEAALIAEYGRRTSNS